MKKTLLALACVMSVSYMASADSLSDGLTLKNSKSYTNIVNAEDASRSNAMVYDADNNLFTSGVFTNNFEGLEAVASSSYVMKNDVSLNPLWKVAIQGAATVKSMLSDGNGGVYVAGNFADEIVLNGTDGDSKSLAGYKSEGAYVTSQSASFIAHYDKDGKILKASAMLPELDDALNDTGMYFPEAGDVYCNIQSLAQANGKLYAVALFTNKVTAADKSTAVSGSSDVFGGGFYYMSLRGAVVFEINNDMQFSSVLATVKSGNFNAVYDLQQVVSVKGAAKDNMLYLSFVATGTEYVVVNNTPAHEFPFNMSVGGYNFGTAVIGINVADKTLKVSKSWESATTEEYQATTVNTLDVAGDNLIISGIFQQGLGFDSSITSAGSSDMYVASLNANTLDVNWAKATGYDEGEVSKNEEITTGNVVAGKLGYLVGYTSLKSDHSFTSPLAYAYDVENGTITPLNADNTYHFGVAATADGATLASAYTALPLTGITFGNYTVSYASAETIEADKLQVTLYPNPVVENLNISQTADVEIYTTQGALVTTAKSVNTVDLSTLAAGMYLVKVSAEGKEKTATIIKK